MNSTHSTSIARAHAFVSYLFAVLLLAPTGAWAEVAMRIAFDLNGPLTELQAAVKEGHALQKRLNPDARHELWVDEIHGDHVGAASLVVYYQDLAHYAQAQAREDDDAEWQAFLEGFPQEKFPATYVGLLNVVLGDGRPAATGGEVLNIFGFEMNGSPDTLAEQVRRGAEIQKELKVPVTIALVSPLVSGELVSGATLLARYPSFADYAATVETLETSEEWQAFLEAFPQESYPLSYRGLSRAISIE